MSLPWYLIVEEIIFSPWPFFLGGLVLWGLRRRKTEGQKISPLWGWAILWGGLILLSSTPVFHFFSVPLKEWVPANQKIKAEAIVVASAGVHESGAPSPGSTLRAHTAAQLYLEGLAPLIVVTGAVTHPYTPPVLVKGEEIILRGMGVPPEKILIDNKSTTTHMNGMMAAEILKARQIKKILLVSQDYHLPRLVAVFEKLGFEVIPYAAPQLAKKDQPWWTYLDWDNFNRLRTIAHEYLGLLYYRLNERI